MKVEAKAARRTEDKLHEGGDITGHWKVERSASAKEVGGIAGEFCIRSDRTHGVTAGIGRVDWGWLIAQIVE